MGKFVDLTGMVFNELTVVKRAEDRIQPSGQHCRMWLCLCSCGEECIVSAQNLKSGHTKSCGHLFTETMSNIHKVDIAGMVFGELTVIEEAGRYISPQDTKQIMWRCICTCGKEVITNGNSLRQGNVKSCGHLKKVDLTGQQFGWLIALKPGNSKGKDKDGYDITSWLCYCTNCGGFKEIRTSSLTSGAVISDGCVKSTSEKYIKQFLQSINVNFDQEFCFKELRIENSRMPLRFDFAIFNNEKVLKGLIEFQGIHHYKESYKNWGDKQRLITDPMKREYCKQNNIPLLEIPYTKKKKEYEMDILKFLQSINVSYVNPVPSLANEEGATTIPEGSSL